ATRPKADSRRRWEGAVPGAVGAAGPAAQQAFVDHTDAAAHDGGFAVAVAQDGDVDAVVPVFPADDHGQVAPAPAGGCTFCGSVRASPSARSSSSTRAPPPAPPAPPPAPPAEAPSRSASGSFPAPSHRTA